MPLKSFNFNIFDNDILCKFLGTFGSGLSALERSNSRFNINATKKAIRAADPGINTMI